MSERTVRDAFEVLLKRSTPTETERGAASRHRGSVDAALAPLGVFGSFETGSFRHGTGVRHHSDVDIFVSLKGPRPLDSTPALNRVRAALAERFQGTPIRVSRPAVVVDFAGGDERWEVIPAYYRGHHGDYSVYDIPSPGGTWMQSAPTAHMGYVNEANRSPDGATKKLARLVKAWKYANRSSVRVSSFYLEMRTAEYMKSVSTFVPYMDFAYFLGTLARRDLASMTDPTGAAGIIRATSTDGYRDLAMATLRGDAKRANDAVRLFQGGRDAEAFAKLDSVFAGGFPSRFY